MPKLRLGVALLLPPAVAAEVEGLRRACEDGALERVPPHLTLVPPVNVRADRLDEAVEVVRRAASATEAFSVTLGPVATFWPDTPVLYLAVTAAQDVAAVQALRDAVFVEPLRRELTWPFVPHVTIADGGSEERLRAAASALRYVARVGFESISLLQEQGDRTWTAIATAPFGPRRLVGRGGLALELGVAGRLDPDATRIIEGAWRDHLTASYGAGPDGAPGEPYAVTARRAGEPVGAVLGTWRAGGEAWLDGVIVVAAERGLGVGAQLLAEVEHAARARGCTRLLLVAQAGGPAERFYAGRGWTVDLALPGWRAGRDFVRMVRTLG